MLTVLSAAFPFIVQLQALDLRAYSEMLTLASLLAAMTIAGAFWVGVLAARRLREWGEKHRAIEMEERNQKLALATSAPSKDQGPTRIRSLVASRVQEKLQQGRLGKSRVLPRETNELEIDGLRCGDVVMIENAETKIQGDYLVEGIVRLLEGRSTTIIAILTDAGRKTWLIGSVNETHWIVATPVFDHHLHGEPPRDIQREVNEVSGKYNTYTLERRGQASAACLGKHDRPPLSRVAVYTYRHGHHDVLWLERWDMEIMMAEGLTVSSRDISFLPGS